MALIPDRICHTPEIDARCYVGEDLFESLLGKDGELQLELVITGDAEPADAGIPPEDPTAAMGITTGPWMPISGGALRVIEQGGRRAWPSGQGRRSLLVMARSVAADPRGLVVQLDYPRGAFYCGDGEDPSYPDQPAYWLPGRPRGVVPAPAAALLVAEATDDAARLLAAPLRLWCVEVTSTGAASRQELLRRPRTEAEAERRNLEAPQLQKSLASAQTVVALSGPLPLENRGLARLPALSEPAARDRRYLYSFFSPPLYCETRIDTREDGGGVIRTTAGIQIPFGAPMRLTKGRGALHFLLIRVAGHVLMVYEREIAVLLYPGEARPRRVVFTAQITGLLADAAAVLADAGGRPLEDGEAARVFVATLDTQGPGGPDLDLSDGSGITGRWGLTEYTEGVAARVAEGRGLPKARAPPTDSFQTRAGALKYLEDHPRGFVHATLADPSGGPNLQVVLRRQTWSEDRLTILPFRNTRLWEAIRGGDPTRDRSLVAQRRWEFAGRRIEEARAQSVISNGSRGRELEARPPLMKQLRVLGPQDDGARLVHRPDEVGRMFEKYAGIGAPPGSPAHKEAMEVYRELSAATWPKLKKQNGAAEEATGRERAPGHARYEDRHQGRYQGFWEPTHGATDCIAKIVNEGFPAERFLATIRDRFHRYVLTLLVVNTRDSGPNEVAADIWAQASERLRQMRGLYAFMSENAELAKQVAEELKEEETDESNKAVGFRALYYSAVTIIKKTRPDLPKDDFPRIFRELITYMVVNREKRGEEKIQRGIWRMRQVAQEQRAAAAIERTSGRGGSRAGARA